MKFNINEIAKKLSCIMNDNVRYDEERNTFTGFMNDSEISCNGIHFFINGNEPCDYELELTEEGLEYIINVINLLKENKSTLTAVNEMKKIGKS